MAQFLKLWIQDVKSGQEYGQPLLTSPFTGFRLQRNMESIDLMFRKSDSNKYTGPSATYEGLLESFQHAIVDFESSNSDYIGIFSATMGTGFSGYAKSGSTEWQYSGGKLIHLNMESGTFTGQGNLGWLKPPSSVVQEGYMMAITDQLNEAVKWTIASDGSEPPSGTEGDGGVDPSNPPVDPDVPTSPEWSDPDVDDPWERPVSPWNNGVFTSSVMVNGMNSDLNTTTTSIENALTFWDEIDEITGLPLNPIPDDIYSAFSNILADLVKYPQMLLSIAEGIMSGAQQVFEGINAFSSLSQQCAISRLLSLSDIQALKDLGRLLAELEAGEFMQAIQAAIKWVKDSVMNLLGMTIEQLRNLINLLMSPLELIKWVINKIREIVVRVLTQISKLLASIFGYLTQLGFISGLLNCARSLLNAFNSAMTVLKKLNPEAAKTVELANEIEETYDNVAPEQKPFYVAESLDEQRGTSQDVEESSVIFRTASADLAGLPREFVPPI